MKVKLVKIWICQACLDGAGEECHTPSCSLFLHSVDLPIHPELYEVLTEIEEPETKAALDRVGREQQP